MIEKLLKAGMNVAWFNFSYGSHAYHQETLDNLRTAIQNTDILCAVMLDTKGPEIRTGFLKEGKTIELIQGQEVTATGSHPETVVRTMSRLCKETEDSIDYRALHMNIRRTVLRPLSKIERTAATAVTIVARKMNAKAIFIVAKSGFKVEVVAKFRPSVPVLSVVDPVCPNSEAHVASRGYLVYVRICNPKLLNQ